MNLHSKLEPRLARSVVAASCFAALLSFGSTAASQSAPVTLVPTNPKPTAAAPAPAAPVPAPGAAPTTATPATATSPTAAPAPQATTEDAPAPTTAPADTEFAATEKPAPLVLGEEQPTDQPEPAPARGPFSRGAVRLTLLVGTGSTRTDNYFIIGGGLGYFILNGLEVGLDYEGWFFANPVMHRVSPEARYVFHMVPVIKPYAGVFYRRTYVMEDNPDYNQLGGRVGAYYVPRSGRMYIGGGAVYERTLDCSESAYLDCDSWYPEISFGISL